MSLSVRRLRERVVGRQRPFVVRFDTVPEFERDADRLRGQGLYLVSSGYAPDGTIRTVWSGDVRYAGCEAGAPLRPALPFDGAGQPCVAAEPPHRPRLVTPPAEPGPVGWWEMPDETSEPAPAPLTSDIPPVAAAAPPEPAEAPAPEGPPVIAVTSFAETTAAIR